MRRGSVATLAILLACVTSVVRTGPVKRNAQDAEKSLEHDVAKESPAQLHEQERELENLAARHGKVQGLSVEKSEKMSSKSVNGKKEAVVKTERKIINPSTGKVMSDIKQTIIGTQNGKEKPRINVKTEVAPGEQNEKSEDRDLDSDEERISKEYQYQKQLLDEYNNMIQPDAAYAGGFDPESFDYVDYSSRFPLDKMLRTSDEDPISDKRFDAGYVRESPYDYIDYPRTYTGFLPPKRHLPELPLDDMALTSDPAVFLSNLLESASKGDPQSADIINALLNMKSQLSEERDLKTYLEDLSGKDEPMMTGELPPRGISQNAAPFGVNDPLSQASNEDNGSLNRIPAERRQKEPKLTVHESVNKLQFTRPKPTPAIPLAEKQKKKA